MKKLLKIILAVAVGVGGMYLGCLACAWSVLSTHTNDSVFLFGIRLMAFLLGMVATIFVPIFAGVYVMEQIQEPKNES